VYPVNREGVGRPDIPVRGLRCVLCMRPGTMKRIIDGILLCSNVSYIRYKKKLIQTKQWLAENIS
ncbi:MAG: hypothetical protein KDG55_24785, partial [Rhodocyclaceae bacterium]|nr:hypothetical protein [Rhodocyclaceae bacterium]